MEAEGDDALHAWIVDRLPSNFNRPSLAADPHITAVNASSPAQAATSNPAPPANVTTTNTQLHGTLPPFRPHGDSTSLDTWGSGLYQDPNAIGQVQGDQPTTYSALTMESRMSVKEQSLQEMSNNMSTIMLFIHSVSSQNNSTDPNPPPGGSLPSTNHSAFSDPRSGDA
eukprot:4523099-Ditylum_brightwellii.AAC.1